MEFNRSQKRKKEYVPKETTPEEYGRIWQDYAEHRGIRERNRLVEWNLRLVYYASAAVKDHLPQWIEYEELISSGCIGLIEAVERFDPAVGSTFAAYAVPRILGSIWRGMEKYTGVSRRAFQKMRKIKKAEETLYQEKGRRPLDVEIISALQMKEKEYQRWRNRMPERAAEPYEALELAAEEDTASQYEEADLVRRLRAELRALEPVKLSLIQDVYYREQSLRSVSARQGISRWRLQKMHHEILEELRRKML